MRDRAIPSVIRETNATAYFHDSIAVAMDSQRLSATDTTVVYVVNVLTTFLRADQLFEYTQEGWVLKPLADFYFEALEAPSEISRNSLLRKLGDVALFVAGVLSQSFNRRSVGRDYYIAMGGNAYEYLSSNAKRDARGTALSPIFAELSGKFGEFAEVISDVSQRVSSNTDIMKIYESWLHTGSPEAERRLHTLGISVAGVAGPH